MTLSRRDFLRRVGLMSLAAATPGLQMNAFAGVSDKQRQLKSGSVKVDSDWDVVVVGGGPAGCAAAISAAREGARTLLVEATGQLGGMGTIGLVPTWSPFSDGERIVYRGLAYKIMTEARKGVPHERKNNVNWVSINAEQLMRVYDQMVTESGARVLFFSRLCAVQMRNGHTIDSIVVANKQGLMAFRAKVFIDTTGDGDLAAWAGADYERGIDDEGHEQLSSLCFAIAGVDSYAYQFGGHIDTNGDRKSPLFEAAASGRYPLVDAYANCRFCGPGVVQFNAGHIDVNSLDPWSLSEAMMLGRQKAQQYLEALKEYRPDAFGNAFVVKTAQVLGTRDSRHIEGDYRLTVDDWRARRTFNDEIGRNCYYIDIHSTNSKPERYGKGESHGIPYRTLTPKKLRNVLTAGRCISADAYIFGSIRIMPCCLVTGEAAGVAAKHAIDESSNNVHNINVSRLRDRLLEAGAYFK